MWEAMRKRSSEELDSAERLTRLMNGEDLRGRGVTPKIVREFIRDHMAFRAAVRLFRIGNCKETESHAFVVALGGGAQELRTVDLPASLAVQTRALLGVLGIGVPRQLDLTGGDDNPVSGVIALPALEMSAVQDQTHGHLDASQAPPEPTLERVEDVVEVAQRRDADPPPPPFPEETVDPATVRAIRGRRNGHHGVAVSGDA